MAFRTFRRVIQELCTLEGYRQSLEATQRKWLLALELISSHAKIGHALEKSRESYLPLRLSQRRAQTVVDSVTECQMFVAVGSRYVEKIGVFENCWVAIYA